MDIFCARTINSESLILDIVLHLWTTGNRRLEIYCHGLGSLVLVAVYIGMHYGDGWNYSESSITLWYERTYWCEAFRNSKIHNLVLEQMNVLINSIKVVFECNSRCGYVYVVACLYKSYETYKNDRRDYKYFVKICLFITLFMASFKNEKR